jgi:phage terminase large subunit
VITDLQLPKKAEGLFRPRRYKVRWGGRGSAKSWSIARVLIMLATNPERLFPGRKAIRILCAREFQNSIKESVHQLLRDQIDALGVGSFFEVTDSSIRCVFGSEFIFSGIRNNVTKIKSMEGIDIVWVEEAEKVSKNSWQILIPTIRKSGSEIWVSFNPDEATDPTSKRFLLDPPPDADVEQMNWQDNPWFPEELKKEKDYLYSVDADAAEHVWGGHFRKASADQIFRGKYIIEDFEPVTQKDNPHDYWQGPYYGADWGFSNDPTVLIKMWIYKRKLYIEYESFGYGTENEEIAPLWKREVPGCVDGVIRADCSRPETISYVRRTGNLRVQAAKKWEGSIEDGIKFLRSFEKIVVHSRCEQFQIECKFYRYKVDKLTQDVLRDIVDAFNHGWDAVRYALEPLIGAKQSIYDLLED